MPRCSSATTADRPPESTTPVHRLPV